jgi:hypothetical protein
MAAPDVSALTADTEGGGRIDAPPSFLLPAAAQSQCRQVPGKQHSRLLFPGEWRSRMRPRFSYSSVSDACTMAVTSRAYGSGAAALSTAQFA